MPSHGLELAPFRGLRYAPRRVSSLAAVTSPPYDVVVRPDGQRALESAEPYNVVRLILPRPPDGTDSTDATAGHRLAAATLRRWQAEGVLVRDREPTLYVYEQRASGGTLQRGLIGALRLTPPAAGVVLPHEDVIPEVVADRTALMRATAANLEPLLLSYRGGHDPSGAAAVIERAVGRVPLLAVTAPDGATHRLWAVTDHHDIAEATGDLARHRALIADGHHRWATYLRLAAEHADEPPWDRGLVLLVDTTRYPLRVRAIHRVLPTLTPADALSQSHGAFRTRRLATNLPDALSALANLPPTSGNAYVLAAGPGQFHLLDRPDPRLLARSVPADRPRAWRELDATVLHAALLRAVWRLPNDPARVRYLHDAAAAVAAAEAVGGTALLMRPVNEETVRALAEQRVPMPQKSTSFGPKPASGLVLRTLDQQA